MLHAIQASRQHEESWAHRCAISGQQSVWAGIALHAHSRRRRQRFLYGVKSDFCVTKGPRLATFSAIRKHQLLFHPKPSFKMSVGKGGSLPAAKCHQPPGYRPHQALNPVSQLSQGHMQSRATSGGICSNLCTGVSLWGHARVGRLHWEHLFGDLPHSVTSVPLEAAPGEVFPPAGQTHPPQALYGEHCPCL